MNPFSLLCGQMSGSPILMRPDAAERLLRAMSWQASGARPERVDADLMSLVEMRQQAMSGDEVAGSCAGCAVIDGVAVIPVHGPLLQRRHWLWEIFGFTSYELIAEQIERLAAEKAVRAFLLDVDSPGGVVSGCFDAARKVRSAARDASKPLIGASNEAAFSAAYALISACDEVYGPETSAAGSIGVWTLHSDYTRALDKEGIELTVVRAGDRKARGMPWERADKETMSKLQDNVEATWQMFAGLVAEHRGIDKAGVLALEGDWFGAEEAMDHGLIDGIGSFDAIFNRARSLAN